MAEKNISQEFRIKIIEETRNYSVKKQTKKNCWVISAKSFVQL